jgi:hypothetical protein
MRRTAQATEEARFRAWSKTTEGRANAGGLEALKGRYTGRRCFVMGNGPSLLKCDLSRLASEITIVSNAHYLIWDQLEYVPTFLAVEDELVAEDRAEDLKALDGITKVFPYDLRPLLGPSDGSTLFVNFLRRYQPFPQFSDDLRRRAYWGGTVSFLMLQIASFLGCDPIILIGFDHSYVVPSRAETDSTVIHSSAVDVNHIHPDYFGPGFRWHDPNVDRMELGYRCARQELERRGVTVLNATVGGQLKVFDRTSFEDLTEES